MLSTRIDSIRTADFTRLRFPPPPPLTWQRPSPSSDLRATLSFPQSRRDNQYAKSNPVQHGRFAVMQNGRGVRFPSGIPLRPVRETRGPRVCKTEPGKLRNDQFIIFVRGRPRPLTDAHKLRNAETPLRPARRYVGSSLAANHNGILIVFLPFPCNESRPRESRGAFSWNAQTAKVLDHDPRIVRITMFKKTERPFFAFCRHCPRKFRWSLLKITALLAKQRPDNAIVYRLLWTTSLHCVIFRTREKERSETYRPVDMRM